MPCKTDDGSLRAASQPDVFGIAEMKFFSRKTDFVQAFGKQFLAISVVGGNGRAGNQRFGEF